MNEKGFKIPENYFEQRKASLKGIAEENPKVPKRKTIKLFGPWLAAAAVIAIALFLIPGKPPKPEVQLSELQTEVLMDFLSEDPYAVYPESFIQIDDTLTNDWDIISEDDLEHYLDNRTYEYL